ncbi:hypothetical protein GN956_G17806 [Arapaima gigas]
MAPAEPRPPRRVYLAGLASLASLTALDRTNGHLLSWTCQFVLVRTEPLREDCAEVGPLGAQGWRWLLPPGSCWRLCRLVINTAAEPSRTFSRQRRAAVQKHMCCHSHSSAGEYERVRERRLACLRWNSALMFAQGQQGSTRAPVPGRRPQGKDTRVDGSGSDMFCSRCSTWSSANTTRSVVT